MRAVPEEARSEGSLDALELEFQRVMNHRVGVGMELQFSPRASSAVSIDPSFQLNLFLFLIMCVCMCVGTECRCPQKRKSF